MAVADGTENLQIGAGRGDGDDDGDDDGDGDGEKKMERVKGADDEADEGRRRGTRDEAEAKLGVWRGLALGRKSENESESEVK